MANITFTCNAKLTEIETFLSKSPRQKAKDRPDTVIRVFKIKLNQLLHDLKHGQHLGRLLADNNFYHLLYLFVS